MKHPAFLWMFAVAGAALIGPGAIPLHDAAESLELLSAPSPAHPLGTDEEGRDVVAMLMVGARTALLIGLSTVAICGLIGTLLGAAAGYFGGLLDRALMTATEAVYAFPGILLAIFLMFLATSPGPAHVVGALCVSGWASYARLARGQAMTLRERPFIEAARALGLKPGRILTRHVIPQILPLTAIQAAFGVANAILAEAALSFLGLGIADGTSWGAMLSSGAVLYLKAPALAVAPGAALAATVLAVLVVADRLQRVLDPRSRMQHG